MFHTKNHKNKHPASPAEDYVCDHPSCTERGQYPAPKSRHDLKNYFFFCLEHVRLYNKNWNYYEGMNYAQIEAERDADVIGHRPLWSPERPSHPSPSPEFPESSPEILSEELWRELQDFLNDDTKAKKYNYYNELQEGAEGAEAYDEKTRMALQLLQVKPPINLHSIKAAYKFWAKKFHPDSQIASKDKTSQDKMKSINQAYATLKLAFAEKTP